MSDHYILVGKTLVKVGSIEEWGRKFEDSQRRVAYAEILDWRISTVFLGLDHRFGRDGPPILFETMVFPMKNKDMVFPMKNKDMVFPMKDMIEEHCERTSTWDEAMSAHRRACGIVVLKKDASYVEGEEE